MANHAQNLVKGALALAALCTGAGTVSALTSADDSAGVVHRMPQGGFSPACRSWEQGGLVELGHDAKTGVYIFDIRTPALVDAFAAAKASGKPVTLHYTQVTCPTRSASIGG
jgi:hypothetical protein